MPKFKIVCLILAIVLATVGTGLVVTNLISDDIPDFEVPTKDLNTYLDLTEDIDVSDPDIDARKFLFVAHKVLLESEGFVGVSTGTTTAMNITQSVLNTRYVVGEFGNKKSFKEMVTKGIVSNAYQLYMSGDNYIFRNFVKVKDLDNVTWEDSAQPLKEDVFYSRFGHRNDKLIGYILNWDTVKLGELYSVEDDLYTFHYVLDTNQATPYLKREMITNGNLQSEPNFSKCEIYVTMDTDFVVKSVRTSCAYEAKTMGINASCEENITETFEPYYGDLPYVDFFGDYFDQEGGDITIEETALDAMLNMLSPYIEGEDLQVEISAEMQGERLFDALLSISNLDISDLSKLTVAARINDKLDIAYSVADSKIYLQYQDFKGSTTVDGILGLVDTIQALVGGEASTLDSLELTDFDFEALLENLTYSISDDGAVCTVNLPISIAGLNINANLYADVDGKAYNFTHATVTIDDVVVNITPKSWQTTDVNVGDYPEILGLADLIQNGKISLLANVSLPFGDDIYKVSANVLVDLKSLNLSVEATLGSNGTVNVLLVDNIAYVAYGNVKLKLDTTNTDSLVALIERIVGGNLTIDMPEISTDAIWAMLSEITATQTDGGVAFLLSIGEIDVTLNLKSANDRWEVETVIVTASGIDATIAPSDTFEDVMAPTDAADYADITELIETFEDPIWEIVNGESYGAEFALSLMSEGKRYDVVGSFAYDMLGTLQLNATVYDGNVGIIDAEVIYANDSVYLTLNGIRVAFELGNNGGSNADIYEIVDNLLANQDMKALIDSHESIREIIEQISAVVEKVTELQLSDLLDVDFSAIFTNFSFVDKVLSLTVDGGAFGLDGLNLSLTLANDDGNLAFTLGGLEIANVSLQVAATIEVNIDDIEIPNADDYVLNLHGEILGAEIELSADFVRMDVWASVRYNEEIALLRYVDGSVYVVYGGAKIVIDTSDIDEIINKLTALLDDSSQSNMLDGINVLAILSAISVNLTSDTPNVSLGIEGVNAQINFENIDGKLVFSNIAVSFEIDGNQYVATLTQQTERAAQLDKDGEFVDGNELINQVLDTVEALKDIDSFEVNAQLDLTVKEKAYLLDVTFKYNEGIYVNVVLNDKVSNKTLVSAEIYVVDGVLYLDINGIRQAVELPTATDGEFDILQIFGAISEFDGISDQLDSILQSIEQLPDKLDGIVFFKFIEDLYFNDNNNLVAVFNLEQLDLDGITLTLGLGEEIALKVDGFAVDNIAVNIDASLRKTESVVVAPSVDDYTTELYVDLGNGMSALVMLDLYHGVVEGQFNVTDKDVVAFKYVDGVVYLTYGNVNAKVAIEDIPELIEAIGSFVELPDVSQMDGDILEIAKEWISKIIYQRNATANGYSINVALDNVTIAINFDCTDSKATLESVAVTLDGFALETITVQLAENLDYGKIDIDAEFVDVAAIVETFATPVLKLLNSDSYGADFELNVTLGDVDYTLSGKFDIDVYGNIKVNATVYTDGVGIIDAEVIYANNTVFLTVNGVKVAFAVGNGSSEVNFDQALDELLTNEQIQLLLGNYPEFSELIDQLKTVIGNFTQLDITSIDFAQLISSLSFNEGKLILAVNGSDFELGKFKLVVANDDGYLSITLADFALAGVKLNSVSATVFTDVSEIGIPNTDDYILNLHATVAFGNIAADVEISLDLYTMDVWASIQIQREVILVRYLDGKVYVKYGNVALKLDTASLSDIISRISALVGSTDSVANDIDVDAILSAISFNLTSQQPNISYDNGEVQIAVNFENLDGVLSFSNIILNYGELGVVVAPNGKPATRLDDGATFIDGNKLVNQILNTVEAFIDVDTVVAELTLNLDVDGDKYEAVVTLNYNGGLYATLKLSDVNGAFVTAEIYFVDNTLYFDVNGIRQAIDLSDVTMDSGDINLEALADILAQVSEVLHSLDNDVINSILETLEGIPTNFDGIAYSAFVSGMYYQGDTLVVGVDLAQLGLGEFTLSLDLGDEAGINVDGLTLGKVSVNLDATVQESNTAVIAPDLSTYVTELMLTVGDGITAFVKLDLFHNTVVGKAEIYGNTVNFKLVDGTIYATYGDANTSKVAVMLNLADVNTLLDAISRFVELPTISFGGSESLVDTVNNLLDKISITKQQTTDGYNIEIIYDQIAVVISFGADGGALRLDGIELNVGEIAVSVKQISGETYPDVATDGNFVDIVELVCDFADPIADIIDAEGYSIGVKDVRITLGSEVYGIDATLKLIGGNFYAEFNLEINGVNMLEGQIWVVDGVLYLEAGDLRLAVSLGENIESDGASDIEQIKETLDSAKGYNEYVDEVIELVQGLLEVDLASVDFEQILSNLAYSNGNLTLGINGDRFGLSTFTLTANSGNGLNVTLDSLSYNGIAIYIGNANIAAYDGEIIAPTEDFTTNLVIDVQPTSGTGSEHNVIYVNIDLLNGAIFARIETTMSDGSKSNLDIKYTFADNVLKLTNGDGLNVLVNIDSISDIIYRINDIVNEFADAGDQALPDLLGSLGDVDLKAIVKSLSIRSEDGEVLVRLSALGIDVTAAFKNGLKSVTVPVDLIESNLIVSASREKCEYDDFADSKDYVSINQVFNDYFYGEDGDKDDPQGAIYNLVHTNSWKFDFVSDSEIDVLNDDGTTTKYQIIAGSYIAFYYNKTEADNVKIRANLTVQKDGGEFLYLDVAFIDGRIYATYDSRKIDNTNELKATISLDALMETVDLLPALIKIVPQIGTLIDSLTESLSNVESKLTLGNVSRILDSVSYIDRVFTICINGRALDANNFGSDPITLKVSNFGTVGLSLDELSLSFGNVSINLVGLVVTGSDRNVDTGEFIYVEDYINSYLDEHGGLDSHMNLDSIRELLTSVIITAGDRSFEIDGNIVLHLSLGIELKQVTIGVSLRVDIDENNNSYWALKITRAHFGILGLEGLAYSDYGGTSYLLFDSAQGLFSVVRHSYTSGSVLGFKGTYKEKNYFKENIPADEFLANITDYIFELFNFSNLIRNLIENSNNENLFGVEDILKGYEYSESDKQFKVNTDLSPIDSNLGKLNIQIHHQGNFDNVGVDEDGNLIADGLILTKLTGDMSLVRGIITVDLDLALGKNPTYGVATGYVTGHNYSW